MTEMASELLVWYPRNSAAGPKRYDHENMEAVGPFRYYNIKDFLARCFVEAYYRRGAIGNWRHSCIGVLSSVTDPHTPFHSMHMPIFDYDGKNVKKQIRHDVKVLQKEYLLGDAWVYSTKRGFHVYFFCDSVTVNQYREMLEKTKGCKGFKTAFDRGGYSVIRLSAKYTKFDIKPLYILKSKDRYGRRMGHKAHLIRAIISLGQECGTHFASMYPQWATYVEDQEDWKPGSGVNPSPVKAKLSSTGLRQPHWTRGGHPREVTEMDQQQAHWTATTASTASNFVLDDSTVGYNDVKFTVDYKTPPGDLPKKKKYNKADHYDYVYNSIPDPVGPGPDRPMSPNQLNAYQEMINERNKYRKHQRDMETYEKKYMK